MSILIATAEQEVYRGRANMVVAPSVAGEMAVLPGHAPLLAVLRPGEIRIDCPKSETCAECYTDSMVVHGGFMEVQPDVITILADAVERADDIDIAQAQHAAEQAKKLLTSPDRDKASRALLELELAIAELRVARRKSRTSFMKP